VLDLSGNQLTSVPAELWRLTALHWLVLSDNHLASVPKDIGGLTALGGLNLNNNKLTSVPKELGNVKSLTSLYLDGNQLTSLPSELGRAVQVDPIKPTLKPTGTKRLKLKWDEVLSSFAFKFNLRRYSSGG